MKIKYQTVLHQYDLTTQKKQAAAPQEIAKLRKQINLQEAQSSGKILALQVRIE